MTTPKTVLTDPARELAELCEALQIPSQNRGENFLAESFSVPAWSPEFYHIIFAISERCALVKQIVSELEIDDDYKEEIQNHITQIMEAFSASAMRDRWDQRGYVRLAAVNVQPIKAISPLVRQHISYAKISQDEVGEIESEITTLLEWLRAHQISEQDFVRQALIEGLERFLFRLTKLQWVGWGYALNSLREVIGAYLLLERGGIDASANPDAAAILQKVGGLIKSLYNKVGAAKEVQEKGEWLVKMYGLGSLMYQSGKPIAGLLGLG